MNRIVTSTSNKACNLEEEQLQWLRNNPPSIKLKFPNGEPKINQKKRIHHKSTSLLQKNNRHLFGLDAEVDEELDLHGMTVEQGVAAADDFIKLAHEYGFNKVRIIHGIGKASGGSLRMAVRDHIKRKCGKYIEKVEIEGHNDGAVIVKLIK